MSECETPAEWTDDEREFLDTYARLLRLLFAPRVLAARPEATTEGEAA